MQVSKKLRKKQSKNWSLIKETIYKSQHSRKTKKQITKRSKANDLRKQGKKKRKKKTKTKKKNKNKQKKKKKKKKKQKQEKKKRKTKARRRT
ncbi:hypothetical protein HYD97_03830 [Mycoplasmopsis bovis]|nr:hypothetical protein [Mycoplasmopsis bovis]QQH34519.1 hypothetical protein HYD97_03830 [Mycoplasmopsis bovis]